MSRRLVAVLFLDIVGWTGLSERVDPEPLQVLLEQYYELCVKVVAEHGGEIEKFIGDAIMAVFGAATSQEDDALRALRAAFRIRAGVLKLLSPDPGGPPMEIHCGIATGEALVTRSSLAGLRVVGDVVNLAARLQSMAAAGQVLVNETTAQLAKPHFTMLAVPPLALKGKSAPVPALLATGPAGALVPHGQGARMVDRTSERARLRDAFDRVIHDQRAQVIAVVGPLGIGKTRLVMEVADLLGASEAERPTVVVGSCPFYGPLENYDAMAQVLEALNQVAIAGGAQLQGNENIAAVLSSLGNTASFGPDGGSPGPGMEEISWAALELLSAAAANGPLVVVWDNLGWAGRSLLRLISELIAGVRHLPVLMICAGRYAPAELDTCWLTELREFDVIEVQALAPADSAELASAWAKVIDLPEVQAHEFDVLERVTAYSAGNPLFIRLMLETTHFGGLVEHVPPTITAVVGAMIDRLPAPVQELLGAASVIGPTFTVQQLDYLGQSAAGIHELSERQLIRSGAMDGEYAFVQQPVHQIAYARLEKQRRLDWHRCLTEHDVNPAFHLEAAFRLLSDLRPRDPELPQSARDAAEALLRDGTAALRQRDILTAVDLLERALPYAVKGRAACQSVVIVRLSDALMLVGDTRRALEIVAEADRDEPERDEETRQNPDRQARWACHVQRQLLAARLGLPPEMTLDQLAAELEAGGAGGLAWCRFELLRMESHLRSSRFVAADQAVCAALEHARNLGDIYEEDRLLAALCEVRQWSPTPIAEHLSICGELVERFALDRVLLVPVLAAQSRGLALTGNRPAALASSSAARAAVEELQLIMGRVVIEQTEALACSLADEHLEAEGHYRLATHILERAGLVTVALTMQVLAARARVRAAATGEGSQEIATLLERREEMDVRGQILCMSGAARLASAEGAAHPLLEHILPLLADTDDSCMRGEVYFDLAETRRNLGQHTAARVMAEAAIESYAAVGASEPMWAVRAWM